MDKIGDLFRIEVSVSRPREGNHLDRWDKVMELDMLTDPMLASSVYQKALAKLLEPQAVTLYGKEADEFRP